MTRYNSLRFSISRIQSTFVLKPLYFFLYFYIKNVRKMANFEKKIIQKWRSRDCWWPKIIFTKQLHYFKGSPSLTQIWIPHFPIVKKILDRTIFFLNFRRQNYGLPLNDTPTQNRPSINYFKNSEIVFCSKLHISSNM